MRFQTRLLLVYFLLIVLLVGLLGYGFFRYSAHALEEDAMAAQAVMADQMLTGTENLVRPMDFISTYFLSIRDILTSLDVLAHMDREKLENQYYVNEARRIINGALLSYSFDRSFYRVNIITRKDFLTSNFLTPSVSDADAAARIAETPWFDKADAALGKVVLLPPFQDPWGAGKGDGKRVFALVRAVQGSVGGEAYLEVQREVTELDRLFTVPEPETTRLLAVTRAGSVLARSGGVDAAMDAWDRELLVRGVRKPEPMRNPTTGDMEFVSVSHSNYSGVTLLLVRSRSALIAPIVVAGRATALLCLAILLLSLAYIAWFSNRLARPIRELTRKMEGTGLENLSGLNPPLETGLASVRTPHPGGNEIEALNQSFGQLRARLNEAVNREIRSHALQVQAHLDSLQAQVNPHFLYNILNVLSHRGLVNGDEEIVEICDGIASMLRYATGTGSRVATIGEEAEHVGHYLLLMKKRLEHKLAYSIDIAPELLGEPMLKIVLQQFAENAISHGFPPKGGVMRIDIEGTPTSGGWRIIV